MNTITKTEYNKLLAAVKKHFNTKTKLVLSKAVTVDVDFQDAGPYVEDFEPLCFQLEEYPEVKIPKDADPFVKKISEYCDVYWGDLLDDNQPFQDLLDEWLEGFAPILKGQEEEVINSLLSKHTYETYFSKVNKEEKQRQTELARKHQQISEAIRLLEKEGFVVKK